MDETKLCHKCKSIKPIIEFFRDNSTKDKHGSRCKACYKKHYNENIEKEHARYSLYRRKYPERQKVRYQKWHTELKQNLYRYICEAHNHSAIQCFQCGFNNIHALQIDHVNGGGIKEKKIVGFGPKFYRYILALSLSEVKNRYQILCSNCNWIKRSNNREVNQFC